jgi:hypothetical protein
VVAYPKDKQTTGMFTEPNFFYTSQKHYYELSVKAVGAATFFFEIRWWNSFEKKRRNFFFFGKNL